MCSQKLELPRKYRRLGKKQMVRVSRERTKTFVGGFRLSLRSRLPLKDEEFSYPEKFSDAKGGIISMATVFFKPGNRILIGTSKDLVYSDSVPVAIMTEGLKHCERPIAIIDDDVPKMTSVMLEARKAVLEREMRGDAVISGHFDKKTFLAMEARSAERSALFSLTEAVQGHDGTYFDAIVLFSCEHEVTPMAVTVEFKENPKKGPHATIKRIGSGQMWHVLSTDGNFVNMGNTAFFMVE